MDEKKGNELIHLGKDNFEEIINGGKPALVDFSATWCGPCQMMAPILDEIAKEEDSFVTAKLDIDDAPEIAAKYHVMSVPSFLVFVGGEEKGRMMGAMAKEGLVEKVKDLLK
ncbi:MAG: thioredoxin [Patescibacteria group bacterium]|jgi:thioredoxin 1